MFCERKEELQICRRRWNNKVFAIEVLRLRRRKFLHNLWFSITLMCLHIRCLLGENNVLLCEIWTVFTHTVYFHHHFSAGRIVCCLLSLSPPTTTTFKNVTILSSVYVITYIQSYISLFVECFAIESRNERRGSLGRRMRALAKGEEKVSLRHTWRKINFPLRIRTKMSSQRILKKFLLSAPNDACWCLFRGRKWMITFLV